MADSFERVVVAYGISRYMKSENDVFKKVKIFIILGKNQLVIGCINHVTRRVEIIPAVIPIVISFFNNFFNILVNSFHHLIRKIIPDIVN